MTEHKYKAIITCWNEKCKENVMHLSAVVKCKCSIENELQALTSSMCLFLWRVNILMSFWINNVVCAYLISEESTRNVAKGASLTLLNKLACLCGCHICMQINWTPGIFKINHKLFTNFSLPLVYWYTNTYWGKIIT